MKIQILKSCLVDRTHRDAGEVVEVDQAIGRVLIGMRRAQLHFDLQAPAPAAPESAPEEAPAPAAPESAPKPKRTRKA